jgi:hypothetical protein
MTASPRSFHVFRRSTRASIVGVALAVVFAPAAFGHATISGASTFPASSDQRITMDVPGERGDSVTNTNVKVYLPADWTGLGCEAAAPWHCTSTPNALEGRTLIEWNKDAGAGPTTADETFVFAARTGAPGKYTVPVNQTYSSGETVRWVGPDGSETPAPTVTVTAASAATTTTAAQPSTTQPTSATTTAPGATTTSSPAAAVTTLPGTTTTAPGETTTTTTVDTTTSTTNDVAPTTTLRIADDLDHSSLPLVLGVLAVLAVAGLSAFVWQWRKRTPSESPPPK